MNSYCSRTTNKAWKPSSKEYFTYSARNIYLQNCANPPVWCWSYLYPLSCLVVVGMGEVLSCRHEIHSAKNPELSTASPVKPVVHQNIVLHALPVAKNSSVSMSAILVHSTSFFPQFLFKHNLTCREQCVTTDLQCDDFCFFHLDFHCWLGIKY